MSHNSEPHLAQTFRIGILDSGNVYVYSSYQECVGRSGAEACKHTHENRGKEKEAKRGKGKHEKHRTEEKTNQGVRKQEGKKQISRERKDRKRMAERKDGTAAAIQAE